MQEETKLNTRQIVKKPLLVNRVGKKELRERLNNEPFKRKTFSFYRYVSIEDPQSFRDKLYEEWSELGCFGRIYIAREGINAQMSIPEHNADAFLAKLDTTPGLSDMPIKWALVDDGKSFYKLTIKVRPKIVADGLEAGSYDLSRVGKHLTALEFHNQMDDPGTLVIDMRNHYESEIGKFENAVCPDADTFKDAIQMVIRDHEADKDKKVLLYCTGGIRCEKASSFLIHHGFSDVSQLYGGIIEYGQQIKHLGLPSKFIGKNFVFDERLGETVDGQVISHCHQCGAAADTHTNCANNDCHLLFIQCPECASKYSGCCSPECRDILELPVEQRMELRTANHFRYSQSKIYNSRQAPSLLHYRKQQETMLQGNG
ncbi:MAG: rhodanese-related sulfurtransferase [Bacteroidales bacterium]|nr:rhodanese-related sulfurtransferase [Bacteroidales bacterium]